MLKLSPPTTVQAHEQELAESRAKRSNNSFKLLGIQVGESVNFLYDDTITAEVSSEKNHLTFEGSRYSVTALASKLLIEKFGWSESIHVNGWRFFTKDGITLSDLRDSIENSAADEMD